MREQETVEAKAVERILCAAIHYPNGTVYLHQPKNISSGIVICGRRHHNCISIFSVLHENSKEFSHISSVQGFVTSNDRFVTRKEALTIAKAAGQVIHKIIQTDDLYSEDLY